MFIRPFYSLAIVLLCPFITVAQQKGNLSQQFETIAQAAKGTVGVSVLVLETGETAGLNSKIRFPMQSVYKFPIAMAVLHQVDKGKLKLEQPVRVLPSDYIPKQGHSPLRDKYPAGNVDITVAELLRYNVAESDGSACDVLLRIIGGTAVADRYIHDLGIKNIRIALTEQVQVPNEPMQYQNWSTPEAMTALFRKFYTGHVLSGSSYDFLLDLLVNSGPGARRLKAQLPKGTVVAHKTGTSGTQDGLTRATNDAGIITLPDGHHLIITVFVKDAYADQETREKTIANTAKAAWDHFVQEERKNG
ncbi:beta-lactamase class A [Chitinophaga eiseniae]|uniref:Beta-lactamase n=1 Tax=Chitinophaga eiseniae TaxID=634771 RepID=A0A1T4N6E5_9BACT|nr:class A beta-lactamase, subclass A2 [Chitinophaga eiseniae]SJZ74666.1 beta-lactamase class A [Chitinophaga eiseniae]